ncbi:Hsp20/alpha crystallin family protein [Hanamia caeni]|jgi:HSP20 family protein|uniref:Hsp20/alpha crystallin family protein n=1 Tax=Hanamia caeni TaxID=2294116 RepID=A0A3M9NRJ5_9BACT|nr:Hsp20/alpha crystallin family protein [Hanamia caeni]RNI39917.1 Hsp20/alpha crystallin family protein [Hanamia caeni]
MTALKFNQPTLKTIDSFLDNLLSEMPVVNQNSNFNFPAVNITETKDNYELDLNVPGRNKEDFKITVDKNVLTVSYEKKEEQKDDSKKFIKKEFSSRSFKRSFNLDEKINAEAINAKYENGILSLTLPIKEEVKVMPKEIAVS